MHPVIDARHADSAQFPPFITAVKLAVALAIGLLIGFERQWSSLKVRKACVQREMGANLRIDNFSEAAVSLRLRPS